MYIRQIKVKNYRSLKDFKIGSLKPFVVLYGENDSGKSNVLFFLEHIFQQKFIEDITEVAGEKDKIERIPTGFWRGEIDNFTDNFFKNSIEPIQFSILIRFYRKEILAISNLHKEFISDLPNNRPFDSLLIEGNIERIEDSNRAKMLLTNAEFNNKIFYKMGSNSKHEYLPYLNLEEEESISIFNKIMNKLDNAFLRIPNNRYLTVENELERDKVVDLNPSTFKNWMFKCSIDRELELLYRKISEEFYSRPFEYGRISLSRINQDAIEVIVEGRDGLKLPIGRKGTGVQQILLILAYINKFNSPLVGIEELEINLSPKSQKDIFNRLLKLIKDKEKSRIQQIFLTTHSPNIARRNEASRRGVWINDKGETKASKPSEDHVEDFFRFPDLP